MMRISKSIVYVGAALVLFFLGQVSSQSTPSGARCEINVPSAWGEYIGASNFGVAFRDDKGTIRFFSQMPCGLSGRPNIALEIHRTSSSQAN